MTPRDFFPSLGVIIAVPHISKILDYDDEEAFEELKDSIVEQLPGLANRIRKEREETLLKLLPPGYTSPEPLKLATVWFDNPIVLEVARVENAINEMWNTAKRESWDSISINGGIQWSSIASKLTFETKVMATVTKLITDLGVGDPEKITAEELDNVHCRVAMFPKGPKKPVLNMEVGGWRHLVRIPLQTKALGTSKVSLLRGRYERSCMRDWKPATGGFSRTTNFRTLRPPASCGIVRIVGERGGITILENHLRHEHICGICEFGFLRLMLSTRVRQR